MLEYTRSAKRSLQVFLLSVSVQQLFQVACVVLAGSEGFSFQEPEVEGDRRLYALEAVFAEGAPGPADGFLSGEGPDYELAHHRVVERGDLVPLVDGRVYPDAWAAWNFEPGDLAWRRHKVLVGVLGIDPKLYRVPDHRHVFLFETHGVSRRYPDLLLHQVHAGEHLGHGVLDLDTRVHLDKVELFVLDQELHGTSVRVPSLPGQPNRRLCLDHDRVSYPTSSLGRLVGGRGIVRTGHDRHLGLTS